LAQKIAFGTARTYVSRSRHCEMCSQSHHHGTEQRIDKRRSLVIFSCLRLHARVPNAANLVRVRTISFARASRRCTSVLIRDPRPLPNGDRITIANVETAQIIRSLRNHLLADRPLRMLGTEARATPIGQGGPHRGARAHC
jgi:hypothetical protein